LNIEKLRFSCVVAPLAKKLELETGGYATLLAKVVVIIAKANLAHF